MPKNIIICCDGTDNELTVNNNTNIIHIYRCLNIGSNQIAYYNPGVGTLAPPSMINSIQRKWYRLKDLATASSLNNNVNDAYKYLMNHYDEGDKVYFFGFSRGAYTVRMLSGMLQMFGLLHKGNERHLNYILDVYYKADQKFHLSEAFKSTFSKEIKIEFIGVFDTVVAAGGIIRPERSFPNSRNLKIAKHVRHAIAIDERRKQYHCQKVDPDHPGIKEVYFAGVHSDIGGSYREEGLSKITLEWMLGEASNLGLDLKKSAVDKFVYGKNAPEIQTPDFHQDIHNSMGFWWQLAELIPRNALKYRNNHFYSMLDFSFNQPRIVPLNANIHKSVFTKLKLTGKQEYSPSNINLSNTSYIEISNQKISSQ